MRWFDRLRDPRELRPLPADALPADAAPVEAGLRAVPPWMAYLYESDRLWLPSAIPARAGKEAIASRPPLPSTSTAGG